MSYLAKTPFVVFDTETTGLSLTARIVEIGAVKILKGKIVAEFSSLANPGCSIPLRATEIHGINDEMVAKAPSVADVLKKFLNFIDDSILIAHNAVFDLRMLAIHLEREQLPLFPNPAIDTHQLLRKYFPELKKYNLPFLSNLWQSPYQGCHRALIDAQHTAFVFFRILEKQGITFNYPLDEFWQWVGEPLYLKRFVPCFEKCDFDDPKVRSILYAISEEKDIEIIYSNGNLAFKPRKIRPILCFRSGKHYYVEAFCYLDLVVKTFRLDRILKILR
ncbi:MAG TPA: WYL domain-containing protein [Candidatus Desulfofervidus auxilii]|uniref:WYL domain-containing protein n=1 Tax=Desulfofervidus auxilii TaxID=1621989 RepID=A0A7V0IAH6_DESA2|nr:WYL domain-containing protein [Candidatus Desulfofervidus auxilii]